MKNFSYEDWHKATYQHCEDPTEYQNDEEKFYCEECFEDLEEGGHICLQA